jgi:hypothetical protein
MTSSTVHPESVRIDLFWIPLGAGGSGFVRLNGRIYEGIKARMEGRRPGPIYHTALQVHTTTGRFVVETMWPSPDLDIGSRGVVAEGAVFSRRLARIRTFRYEVRCWREGILPDAGDAVDGPQTVSTNAATAGRLLEMADEVPPLVWGRDQLRTGEMWNSNSVISWLLVRSGVPMEDIAAPGHGRAPGWDAGLIIANNKSDSSTLTSA